MRRRTVSSLLVTGMLAAAAASLAPAGEASTSSVSFGVPRVVDPIHVYGEPDIAINPKTGAVHASGPQGTGTQRSIWNVSVDGGDSYRLVQDIPDPVRDSAATTGLLPTKTALGGGGGDTEINFSRNGQTFFTDQAGLACYTAVTTKDDGATTASSPRGCSLSGEVDRQWIAVFDPAKSDHTVSKYKGPRPLAYQVYSGSGGAHVDLSTNGTEYTTSAGAYGPDTKGYPVVDQHTGYLLGPAGNGNGLKLAVGKPDATGKLTFTYHPAVANRLGDDVLFPIVSEDKSRNLYMTWIEDKTYQAWYAWAPPKDEWRNWSKPIKISRPPSRTNIFPWAQAGGDGILDVAWYGTSTSLAKLGADGPSAKAGQVWDVYFAQVSKAASKKPHIEQVKATPHPMHYGDICLLGTACITAAGNRNMADFFKLAIDAEGRANIIYTDSSNRLSQTVNNDTAADHQGAALDTVVKQSTGLNAWTGKKLKATESTAPRATITDPASDALFPPLGGSKVPGADIRSVSVAQRGTDLVFTVQTAGSIADAATAAKMPFAELVVRWQMGDTLYHAGAESDASGNAVSYYTGRTVTTDLCSVSGCKPNYMVYVAPPQPTASAASGQATSNSKGTKYVIRVPLSAIGSPTKKQVLEEVSAFVAASPVAAAAGLDNAKAFADEVALQLEGTKTFNYKLGVERTHTAKAEARAAALSSGEPVTAQHVGPTVAGHRLVPAAVTSGVVSSVSMTSAALASTGLGTAIPVVAILLVVGGALLYRRSRAAGPVDTE